MSVEDGNTTEAKALGKKAARQAAAATRNAAKATQVAAEPVVDEAQEAAQEVAERAQEIAKSTGRKFSLSGLTKLTGNTGQGFIALSVALWAGSVAFEKFSAAFNQKDQVVR